MILERGIPDGPVVDISVCFERILLASLSPSFDRLAESKLARRPSGIALATEDDPFSP